LRNFKPLRERDESGREPDRIDHEHQWSGFDIRDPPSRKLATRMSNPKLHWNPIFASGPLILTFARVPAAMGGEC
jgi:hypothetical protein